MCRQISLTLIAFVALLGSLSCSVNFMNGGEKKPANDNTGSLPKPGTVLINSKRGELILCAVVQHPKDKPCIDDWGQRAQAFVGCSKALGGDAKMAQYFVFLVDVPTEKVYEGLVRLGAKTHVHYSIEESRRHTGLKPETTPDDYLQGDPVMLSIFWKEDDHWVERPYEDFVQERIMVDGKPVIKPWTPHLVFHGSGVIYRSGMGCIACP